MTILILSVSVIFVFIFTLIAFIFRFFMPFLRFRFSVFRHYAWLLIASSLAATPLPLSRYFSCRLFTPFLMSHFIEFHYDFAVCHYGAITPLYYFRF